jgi:hypothetical protein
MSSMRWETELAGRPVYVFVILSWRGTTVTASFLSNNHPLLRGTDRVSYIVPHLETFVFHTRRFLENSDSIPQSRVQTAPRKGCLLETRRANRMSPVPPSASCTTSSQTAASLPLATVTWLGNSGVSLTNIFVCQHPPHLHSYLQERLRVNRPPVIGFP